MSPAIKRGSEYQLGIRLVRQSYRLTAKVKINNQSMVVNHMEVGVEVCGRCRLKIGDSDN